MILLLALAAAAEHVFLGTGLSGQFKTELGNSFEVELEGIPSAGFFWEVYETPLFLEFSRSKILPASIIGGPQKTLVRFKTLTEGKGTILFRYGREGSQSTESTLYVEVVLYLILRFRDGWRSSGSIGRSSIRDKGPAQNVAIRFRAHYHTAKRTRCGGRVWRCVEILGRPVTLRVFQLVTPVVESSKWWVTLLDVHVCV
jgi:hypothetical protein